MRTSLFYSLTGVSVTAGLRVTMDRETNTPLNANLIINRQISFNLNVTLRIHGQTDTPSPLNLINQRIQMAKRVFVMRD